MVSPSLFESIKKEGYFGVEVIRLAWTLDQKNLVDSLNYAGLAVVCQIHTTGGFLQGDEYIYCGEYSVEAHKADFKEQLQECAQLLSQVDAGGFVNVHAGVDAWTNDEAKEFLEVCLEEIDKVDFQVTFETHRQRLFGSPFQTRELLLGGKSSELAPLKLNADLSHWYCACERVFDQRQKRDATWWPIVVDELAKRCYYIHARLGWAQGPQMADPSAPECQAEMNLQVEVWERLISRMKQRGPDSSCYMSPEYGPPPYMPVTPHSQEPVASLPGAVAFTKNLLEQIY